SHRFSSIKECAPMRLIRTALAAAALAAAATFGYADHPPDEHFAQCAKACSDCQRECDSCSAHCAKMVADGKKEHLTTLRTCQDCATHCAAAAAIVARGGPVRDTLFTGGARGRAPCGPAAASVPRGGPFADTICTACAEACARCGKACEAFKDDEMMKKCAEECR